jgi:hypothetical protein
MPYSIGMRGGRLTTVPQCSVYAQFNGGGPLNGQQIVLRSNSWGCPPMDHRVVKPISIDFAISVDPHTYLELPTQGRYKLFARQGIPNEGWRAEYIWDGWDNEPRPYRGGILDEQGARPHEPVSAYPPDILDRIDAAVLDWEGSSDSMRWMPDDPIV